MKLNEFEQIIESKRGILLSDDAKALGRQLVREHRARQRFAAADLARQHAQQHGLLAHEKTEPAERLVVFAALVKKARVPRRFEGPLVQPPVRQ